MRFPGTGRTHREPKPVPEHRLPREFTLYLVRHGEQSIVGLDPLTPHGVTQIEAVAADLRSMHPDVQFKVIRIGDLPRVVRTAEIIAEDLGEDTHTDQQGTRFVSGFPVQGSTTSDDPNFIAFIKYLRHEAATSGITYFVIVTQEYHIADMSHVKYPPEGSVHRIQINSPMERARPEIVFPE